ncbi:peptidoglycan-binding domain-containing protein [Cohaesibacter intestini]|uniref:peptidoglycan-binding domain-containing protein n=1 Tax=Cohaesibacter intestini TaxID=2211145 RepID=UPI0018E57B27|nr:peptidoglycan-binding domain-containing protein [Cohaesibacter intestini]
MARLVSTYLQRMLVICFATFWMLAIATAQQSDPAPDPSHGTPALEAEFMTDGLATEIQGRLLALGFDPKGIDGKLGAGSRAAITAWQKQRELAQTGYLTFFQLELLKYFSHKPFKALLNSNPDLADKMPRMTFFDLDVEPEIPMTVQDRKAFREND